MNLLKNLITILILLFCAANMSYAQNTKHAERGDRYFELFDFAKAIYFYELAYEKDPTDSHVTRQLGLTYRSLGDLSASAEWFEKTLFMDKSQPKDMLYLAEALKVKQRYPQAMKWYAEYAALVPGDSRAQEHLEDPEYFLKLQEKDSDIKVESLVVNDDQPVFGITPFENEYIFSSPGIASAGVQEKSTWNELPYLDLYVGEEGANHELVNIRPIDGLINTRFHDGPASYDKTTNTIFVTRNNVVKGKPVRDNTGTVNLKIYEAQKVNGYWDQVRELTFNSDDFSNAHPCVSFDGQELYFISNRPGGFGGTDIYKSTRTETGWSAPENLGPEINTEGNEMFPYLYTDGTLYFGSDGHAGLGGLDVFRSVKLEGTWTEPVNLGAPINTSNDDFGIIYNTNGASGYFSSNREGGVGTDDLFYFEDEGKRIQLVSGKVDPSLRNGERDFVKVLNPNTGEMEMVPLQSDGSFSYEAEVGDELEFYYKNAESEQLLSSYKVPEDPTERTATLSMAEVVAESSDDIAQNDTEGNDDTSSNNDSIAQNNEENGSEGSETIEAEVNYTTSDMLEDLELNNVYFDLNSAKIREDGKATMAKVQDILSRHPEYRLEISAHTDSRGSGPYNEILSRRRAEAARDYLIAQGVDARRIVMNWYGESKQAIECPDPDDCEEYIYQMNRRAEFKIIVD